jgi:hypothetical protein
MAIIFILVIIYYPKGMFGSKEIDFNKLWARLLPNLPKKSSE